MKPVHQTVGSGKKVPVWKILLIVVLVSVLPFLKLLPVDMPFGFLISGESMEMPLSLTLDSTTEVPLELEYGLLTSVSVSGTANVTNASAVRIWLDSAGESYLVYDSTLVKEEAGMPLVTGLAVDDPVENVTVEFNTTPETPESNESVNLSESAEVAPLNETENITLELVEENVSIVENVSIELNITENVTEPEPAVEPEPEPVIEPMNESVDITPVVEQPQWESIEFSVHCVDSCSLPKVSSENAVLRVEIENAVVTLDAVHYTVEFENRAPEFVLNKTLVMTTDETLVLNLSDVFVDPDNDSIDFMAIAPDMTLSQDDEILTIISKQPGMHDLTFIAGDGRDTTREKVKVRVIDLNEQLEPGVIDTIVSDVEINKPVHWRKVLDPTVIDNYELPLQMVSFTADADVGVMLDGVKHHNYGQMISTLKQARKDAVPVVVLEGLSEIVTVDYETEAPTVVEEMVGVSKKRVTISSELSYENVLAYTAIPETEQSAIRLYWLTDSGRELVDDAVYIDTNSDGLIDRLEWIVPHLSDQTYEITLTILNPVEYLRDNEIWTVRFNATGTADLKISSTNAGWTEMLSDDSDTFDEMAFLNISCGDSLLMDNLVVVDFSGTRYAYSDLTAADSVDAQYFLIEDYSCADIGEFSNFMHKAGYATLMFDFGGYIAYAYDPADYSQHTCSDDWSDTCNSAQDDTYDDCAPGGTLVDYNVSEIYINATIIYPGESVNVTCEYGAALAIDGEAHLAYRNSTSDAWAELVAFGTLTAGGNHSYIHTPGSNLGIHQYRCIHDRDLVEPVMCPTDGGGGGHAAKFDTDDVNLTVEAAPVLVYPNWTDNSTNATAYQGHAIRFNVTWHDELNLSHYNFSHNASGIWVSSDYIALGGTLNYSVNESTFYQEPGTLIAWSVVVNDTDNQFNYTDNFTFTMAGVLWNDTSIDLGSADVDAAQPSMLANLTGYDTNTYVMVNCYVGDCGNITANWTNGDNLNSDSVEVRFNCTTDTVGTYQANFSVNSTEDLLWSNITVDCEITLVDSFPSWSNAFINASPYQGHAVQFNVSWADVEGLSFWNFTMNSTGTFDDEPGAAFSDSTANFSLVNYTFTEEAGTLIAWNFSANDTTNQVNITDTFTFVMGGVIFNQTELSLGSAEVDAAQPSGIVNLTGYNNNTYVMVNCFVGDCGNITANFTNGDDVNESFVDVTFNCTTDTAGYFEANFSVNSTEDLLPYNISVNCTILPKTVPTVRSLEVYPAVYANGTNINISANITHTNTISFAYAQIYYPNGTFWQNLSMSNESAGPDIWNTTVTIPVNGPWGNYTFTIWANDTDTNINATESSFFAPYVTLGSNFSNVGLDGSLDDWGGVNNITDQLGDMPWAQAISLWNVTYANLSNDVAYRVAVDTSERVFVVGYELGAEGPKKSRAWRVMALSAPNGSLLWNFTYSTYGSDIAYDVVVDNQGEVIIAGQSNESTTEELWLVMSLNVTDGTPLWNWTLGNGTTFDVARGIARDSFGTLYVAGDYGDVDYYVVALNATDRSMVWNNSYQLASISHPYDIAVDSSDRVFVVGDNESDENWLIRALNATDGTFLWDAIYKNASNLDIPYGVTVDDSDTIFVIGHERGAEGVPLGNALSWRIMAFNATTGSPMWNRTYSNLSTNGQAGGNDIAIDAFGNLFGVGYEAISAGSNDWHIMALDSTDGSSLWNYSYINPNGATAYGVAVDPSGRVFVVGEETGDGSDWRIMALKHMEYEDFDIASAALANNASHLTAYMKMTDNVDMSDVSEHYRFYVSDSMSTGNDTTPEGQPLPFNYSYRVQVNGSTCYWFNYSHPNTASINCSYANDSDEIEMSISLVTLNLTGDDYINVTFETGSRSSHYDFAPSYASFASYQVAEYVAPAGNAAPNVTVPVFNPAAPYTLDNITANTTVTDDNLDNTHVNFTWRVDGTVVYSEVVADLINGSHVNATLGYANFSQYEIVNVTIFANDTSNDVSAFFTIQVNISNSVPTHDTPAITPASPNTNFNLTCTPQNVIDADSDLVQNLTVWQKDNISRTVLYLPFEGGSNSTHTNDYSSYSNNGTVEGATWNRTGGILGGAYHFDGIDDYIEVTDDPTINFSINDTSEMTLEFWFKADANQSGQNMMLIDKMTYAEQGYGIWLTGADHGFYWDVGKRTGGSPDPLWELGKWHFVALTVGSSYLSLYVDGALVTGPLVWNGSLNHTESLYIGIEDSSDNPFNGTIDELRIYNYSLTADQIFEHNTTRYDVIVDDETSINEEWRCQVTPNDGIEDGAPKNASVVIPPPDFTPPTVSGVTAVPIYPENGTNVNLSVNITDANGISFAYAQVYYPNGTFWQNLSLLNTTTPDVWNTTLTVDVNGPWGNYTFTIWANDTVNNTNATESSTFAPYISLYGPGVQITIDGIFSDWVTIPNVSDETGDSSDLDVSTLSVSNNGQYLFLKIGVSDTVKFGNTSPQHVGSISDEELLDDASSIFVKDGIAYVAAESDDGVEIINVSDEANPVHLGGLTDNTTTALDGASGIYIVGDIAYVASYVDDGVEIFNISDPANPNHLSSITDGGSMELDGALDLVVVGDLAYVIAVVDDGVEILNVSDPTNPTHLGAITDNTTHIELDGPWGIDVVGDIAYVASGTDDGLEILNVSDPTNPVHLSAVLDNSTLALSDPRAVQVENNTAYVTSMDDHGLEILNVSDPANPTHFSNITDNTTLTLKDARSLWVVDGIAYVGSSEGIQVLNVTDPTNPVPLSNLPDNNSLVLNTVYDLYAVNDTLYAVSDPSSLTLHGDGVAVINISDPANIVYLADITEARMALTSPNDVFVLNKTAYVVSTGEDGLEIINVSDPAKPTHLGSIVNPYGGDILLNGSNKVYVVDDIAYVASSVDDALEIINVSDPTNPMHIAAINDTASYELNGAGGLFVQNNTAFVVACTDDGMSIINVTDPANPFYLGEIVEGGSLELDCPRNVFVLDSIAYIASSTDDGIEIVNVSNLTNPVHLGAITDSVTPNAFELDGAWDIYVEDGIAYVASSTDDGVEIINVSDPTNPTSLGNITDDATTALDNPKGIVVVNGTAYVISGTDNGVEVLDVSDPTNPTHLYSITDIDTTLLGNPNAIHVLDNYIYVTSSNESGLEILSVIPDMRYRVFISVDDSTGNQTAPDTDTGLPFKYDYMVESVDATQWRVYNSSGSNVCNATAGSSDDDIEISIPLANLSLSLGNSANITVETMTPDTRYDLAPNTGSFVSYTLQNSPPLIDEILTLNSNLEIKSYFELNSLVSIRVNITDDNGGSIELQNVSVDIQNSTGHTQVANATMVNVTVITNGFTYEYNYTIPTMDDFGTWSIIVYANNTMDIATSDTTTFQVFNPVPVATNLEVSPQEAPNATEINITVNITDVLGVTHAFAQVYYPNGTFWQNLSLLNTTEPDIWNATLTVPVKGTWGNYTFTIWANDSYTATNDTEGSQFLVYIVMGGTAKNIVIDGSFNDWSGTDTLSDEIGTGTPYYDVSNFSLANNASHLFARLALNGPVEFGKGTSIYKWFISVNDTTGNLSADNTSAALPLTYDYMLHYRNETLCEIYNTTPSLIGNCAGANSSNTIEMSVDQSDLGVSSGDIVQVFFETGNTEANLGTENITSWNKTYDAGSAYPFWKDYLWAAALDSKDSLFVTGYGYDLVTASSVNDVWTKKFNETGTQKWNKELGPVSAMDEAGYGAAVDSNDNVFIVGYVEDRVNSTSDYDWWINKLNSSYGTQDTANWNLSFDANDQNDYAFAVALDSNDNVYVVGYGTDLVNDTTGTDMWIKRFNSSGAENGTHWNKSFDSDSGADEARAVAIDSNDNVYVVGTGENLVTASSNEDWWIKKFYANGTEDADWNLSFDARLQDDNAYAIALDSSDNVYVGGVGYDLISTSSTQDWWIKRFYTNGTEDTSWNKSYTGSATGNDELYGLVIDSSDTLYAVGHGTDLVDATTNKDWWIKKFYKDGTEDTTYWDKGLDLDDSGVYDDFATAAIVDSDGNVYVVGYITTRYASGSSDYDWLIQMYNAELVIDDLTPDFPSFVNYTITSSTPNYAPEVTTPVFSPAAPTKNEDITANTTVTDDDNNETNVNFTWQVDGSISYSELFTSMINGSVVNSTLDADNFSNNQIVNVTVFANDGMTSSSTASAQVIPSNSVPTQDTPYITPASPNTTSNLTCNWNNTVDSDVDLTQNITMWYKNNASYEPLVLTFEGGSNSTHTYDYSGHGIEGSVSGAIWNRTGGKMGGAYVFDGNDQIVNISPTGLPDGDIPKSISTWFTADSACQEGAECVLGGFGNESEGQNFQIDVGDEDQIRILGWTEPFHWGTGVSTALYTDSEWHHVAVTYDGTTTSIYLDGVLKNSTTSFNWDTRPVKVVLGDDLDGSGRGHKGKVDEFRIYNHSLTPEQILEHNASRYNSIVLNETAADEQWTCVVTPNDGFIDGTPQNASVVITGLANNAPEVVGIFNTSATPQENGTVTVNIYFNASDDDGYGDMNYSSAIVAMNLSNVWRNSSACTQINYSALATEYNCTVTFNYWDAPGMWDVNITIMDNSSSEAFNDTTLFVYNVLSAMRIVNTSFDFGSATLGASTGAAGNPFILNNTGNVDFVAVNITAYDLIGITDSSEYVGAENFSVNATGDSAGMYLSNETSTLITLDNSDNLTLSYGQPGTVSNQSVWMYVTLPTEGSYSPQVYNYSSLWVITVR